MAGATKVFVAKSTTTTLASLGPTLSLVLVVVPMRLAVALFVSVLAYQTTPYMDEEMHAPAAMRLCPPCPSPLLPSSFSSLPLPAFVPAFVPALLDLPLVCSHAGWNLTWDGRITTPPGPYVFPAALSWLVRAVAGPSSPLPPALCSLPALRAWSLLWLLLPTLAVLLLSGKEKTPPPPPSAVPPASTTQGPVRRLLSSLAQVNRRPNLLPRALLLHAALTYSPVLFSAALFYTDTGSLAWLLASLWVLLVMRPRAGSPSASLPLPTPSRVAAASLLAAVATTFRQTNIVWLVFGVGQAALPAVVEAWTAWRRRGSVTKASAAAPGLLLRSLWPALVPVVAFLAFLRLNGGVVLGDKAAHAPVLHVAQLGYLLVTVGVGVCCVELLLLLVLLPLWVGRGRGTRGGWCGRGAAGAGAGVTRSFRVPDAAWARMSGGQRRWLAALARIPAAAVPLLLLTLLLVPVLAFTSLAHPYLLADNRHHAFVLWARVLGPLGTWGRAALAPVYVACGVLVWTRIVAAGRPPGVGGRSGGGAGLDVEGHLRAALWLAASAITVVPAHLVEFRYFAAPWASALLLMWVADVEGEGEGDDEGGGEVREKRAPAPKVRARSPSASAARRRAGSASPSRRAGPPQTPLVTTSPPPSGGSVASAAAAAGDRPDGVLLAAAAVTLVNLIVTAGVAFVFVARPYTWADGTVARRMW
jgi:alpha-1,2-glucosyltransferase